ncbi:MAG TPA: hypothetical protein VH325_04395 [Bryobacteraceae bacterium]|jgi:hypothetical protein|nr:hypothetical protein [Bryobacteraceae bacterium]
MFCDSVEVAVAVRIAEAAWIDLVDDGALPPVRVLFPSVHILACGMPGARAGLGAEAGGGEQGSHPQNPN